MVMVVCLSLYPCDRGTEQYEDKPWNEGWRYENGVWWCPDCIRRDGERLVEEIAWAD